MEDLYQVLQVAPGVDREAIQAAYQRLKQKNGGTVTADLDYAYEVLSDPQARRIYDNARIDPRGLRALFNIEGRQEKVVWNGDGRVGEEPPPPAAPADPWGLRRETEEPFDGEIELFDPLDEQDDMAPELPPSVSLVEPTPAEGLDEGPPGQESFAWDEPAASEPQLEPDPIAPIVPLHTKPARQPRSSERPAAASPSPPKPKKPRAPRKSARTSAGAAARNGKAATGRKAAAKPKDSPRHARTAASQLLTAPPDLEAITLTTYRPEDFEQPSPPSWWNPVNLMSLFSLVIVMAAAIGGTYYLWDTTRSEDEETPTNTAEQTDPLDSLAAPPSIPARDELPPELEAAARSHVDGFVGSLGESYEFLGYASTSLPDGSYFFAAVGRSEASLDGTHQRVFFFVGEASVGVDWTVDSLSIASIDGLPDGRIRVVYNAFAEGDEACCGSLEPVTVFFSYDGALSSTLEEPPAQILER